MVFSVLIKPAPKKMKIKNIASLERAKKYCFLLLKFRPRCEKEIYNSLKRKKFSAEIIQKTCKTLKDYGFINDNDFAKAWIHARITKSFGLGKIRRELELKGIAAGLIESNIAAIQDNYPQKDVVMKLAKAQLAKMEKVEPARAKQRIYGYLLRRGFFSETIIDVIEELKI